MNATCVCFYNSYQRFYYIMKSSEQDEDKLKNGMAVVILCLVVNLVGTYVIIFLLIKHYHLLQPQRLDVNVGVSEQFQNKSESKELSPDFVSFNESTAAPDASTTELHSKDSPALESIVELKIINNGLLSPSFDPSDAKHIIELPDNSYPEGSSNTSINPAHPPVMPHLPSRKQNKTRNLDIHDTSQHFKTFSKHSKSRKHRTPRKSKILPVTRSRKRVS